MSVYTDHNLYIVSDWSTNPDDFTPDTDRGKKLLDIKAKLLEAGLTEEEIKYGETTDDLAAGCNVFKVAWQNQGDTRRIVIGGQEIRSSQEVTCYFINVTRGGASRWDLRGDYYDIYVDGAGDQDRWFYAIPNVDNTNTDAEGRTGFQGYEMRNSEDYGALDIVIKNSNFSNNNNDSGIFILGRGVQEIKLYSDLNVTIENTRAAHINMGNGSVNYNNSWYKGWIYGSIDFTIKNSQFFNANEASWVNKGGVGTATEAATITGKIIKTNFSHDFRGVSVTKSSSASKDYGIYASFDLTVTGSTTTGNFAMGWGEQATAIWEGNNVMHVNGSTAANFRGWIDNRPAGEDKVNKFTIEINDYEDEDPAKKKTVATGSISNFDVIKINKDAIVQVGALGNLANSSVTIAEGADVTAASITAGTITIDAAANVRVSGTITGSVSDENAATITLAKENILAAGGFSGIGTLSVTTAITEGDVVLVSGVNAYSPENIEHVIVNDKEISYGKYGGQYYLVGTDLVYNIGQTFVVNNHISEDEKWSKNGDVTTMGLKGYSTLGAAQSDAAASTIATSIVFTLEDGVDPNDFSSTIKTAGITTMFYGDVESERYLSLGGQDLVIGGDAAANAEVRASYVSNINNVTVGAVTGSVKAAIDNVKGENDDERGIQAIDLTTGSAAEADLQVSSSTIGAIKLANTAIAGTMTLDNSVVDSIYGGEGNVVLKGAKNTVTTVYAEDNGANIQLTDTSVVNYVAGLSSEHAARATLEYEGGVSARNLVLGDATIVDDYDKPVSGIANTITKIDAKITGGNVDNLYVGADNNVIGSIDLEISGGSFDKIIYGDKLAANSFNLTLSGGTAITFLSGVPVPAPDAVPGDDGMVAPLNNENNSVFYGLVYGGSFTAIDGGYYNEDEELVRVIGNDLTVEGNVKAGSVKNFKSLIVSGGTLNVAGSETRQYRYWNWNHSSVDASGDKIVSVLSESNVLDISGDITNFRAIQAGAIKAANLTNNGLVGTLRATATDPGIALTGSLKNIGYIKTATLTVNGNFENSGKITTVGNVTVGGTFTNDGELFFRSTVANDQAGTFTQEGGLVLSAGTDLNSTGFISTGFVKGVKNLSTSKMYVTGGADITGTITIAEDSEVAFTNKGYSANNYEAEADKEYFAANGLRLGGSITMYDSSSLVVSGTLNSSSKSITIKADKDGKMIGSNELVVAEGGLDSWTINWGEGLTDSTYGLVRTDTSITIYSNDELYVKSAYSSDVYAEGDAIKINGKTFLYGLNIFGTVEEAVQFAQTHTEAKDAKIRIFNDTIATKIDASGYDVILDNSTVGDITAKTVTIASDSTVGFVDATTMTVAAGAVATLSGKIAGATDIIVDASNGSGSRLVINADPEKYELDLSKVTVSAPEGKTYDKSLITGDLFIATSDKNIFFLKSAEGVSDGKIDGATGDALFLGVNAFTDRAKAEEAALAAGATLYLVGFTTDDEEVKKSDGINTVYELAEGGTAILSGSGEVQLAGAVIGSTVYGVAPTYEEQTGNVTFVADNVRSTTRFYIAGSDYDNVTNGNITARITDSTASRVYIGAGSFGTNQDKPITIDVLVQGGSIGGFYGIDTKTAGDSITNERVDPNPDNVQLINADINIKLYDTIVGGTFTVLNTNNNHWNGRGATLLQTYYTAGSINVEIGNTTMTDNIRVGLALEGAGKAAQANNISNTLHIVATDKGSTTNASYLCEWDTIIVDATARLNLNTLQYATIGMDSDGALDDAGALTQVMINMSGYKSGTHTVIQAGDGSIYTDENFSNITVIGDNDMANRCKLSYDVRNGQLKGIVVFDKADDMYVNTGYSTGNNGEIVGKNKQELLFGSNAHTSLASALVYADEWHGTIVVTGGEYESMDFHGNNAEITPRNNETVTIKSIAMGNEGPSGEGAVDDRANMDASLTVVAGVTIDEIDGSKANLKSSELNINGDAKLNNISNFTVVNVKKGVNQTLGNVSNVAFNMTADTTIDLKSLELASDVENNIVIDVAGYVGRSHAVISSDTAIQGEEKVLIWTSDLGKKKPTDITKYEVKNVGNDLVLVYKVDNDTFLNSAYTEGFKLVREDGSYLEYGLNAFNNAIEAAQSLGGQKNTLTITGGEIEGDILLGGANFVMEGGVLNGVVYACVNTEEEESNFSNKTYTINGTINGGIDLTAGEGIFFAKRSAINFGETVTINGNITGAGDTALNLGSGTSTVGLVSGVKDVTIYADGYLKASGIDLGGGTINLKKADFGEIAGNYRLVIDSDTAILNATVNAETGVSYYQTDRQIFALDLSRIYFDSSFTKETVDGTFLGDDLLVWGKNAFNDFQQAVSAARAGGGTLYINNGQGNINVTGSNSLFNMVITDSVIPAITFGLNGNQSASGNYHVVVKNSTINNNAGFILSQGAWNSRNTFNNSTFVVDIENSTLGGGTTRIATFLNADNNNPKNITINVTDSEMRGDLAILADSPFGNNDVVTVNLTNVTAPVTKWWTFFDGYPNEGSGTINVNIKDSVLGPDGGNGFRFALQRSNGTSNQFNGTKIAFSVENTTVNGGLLMEHIEGQNITFQNGAYATLTVKGENYVRYSIKFSEVDIDANSYITGSTMTLRDGTIKVDATGYTGPTKTLIWMTSTLGGVAGINEASVIPDNYFVVYGSKGLVISDGSVSNLYYGASYDSAVTGMTSAAGDILIYEGDAEIVEKGEFANVRKDIEEAKVKLTSGSADNKLFVNVDDSLFDENNAVTGTIADEETPETKFVNLVITGGNFTATKTVWDEEKEEDVTINPTLTPAAKGKTVLGAATIEIAGGVYGKAAAGEDPAVFADINGGTKEAVKGKRTLIISNAGDMYANISNFDAMTVSANITVRGEIADTTALTIDATAGGFLKAESTLGVTSITIDATDYEGGSKKVIESAALADYVAAGGKFTVLGEEVETYFNGTDSLYLVANGIGNVYFDASFGPETSGTEYKPTGELLMYGVNAFDVLSADTIATRTSKDYTVYVLDGNFAATDLTLGQTNLLVDGGQLGNIKLGDDSTVKIAGGTSAVSVKSFTGSGADDATGFSVVLDSAKAASITSIDGINSLTIGAANAANLTAGSISYLAAGGPLTVDFAGYTLDSTAPVTLLASDITNFLKYTTPEEGEAYSRTTVATTNNDSRIMAYYDDKAKALKVAKRGNAAFYDPSATNAINGSSETIDGVANTKVYGFNVSDTSINNLVGGLVDGDTLVVRNANRDINPSNYRDINAIIEDSVVGILQVGYTSGSHTRSGNQTVLIKNTEISNNTFLAGQGSSGDNRLTLFAGEEVEGELTGGFNYTFQGGSHTDNTNKIRVTQNANIGGNTVSVNFVDYSFGGDMELFDNVWNNSGSLKEVNVTFSDTVAPSSKWMWIWDARESNNTTINLTITDTYFGNAQDRNSHDTALGILGNDVTEWGGVANVTISGATSTGRLSAARGIGGNSGSGDLDNGFTADSKRYLSVQNNGANAISDIYLVNMFSEIEVADDAFLTGGTISMSSTNTGFVLLGDAEEAAKGTYGNFKEYVSVSGSINGTKAAKFVDKTDKTKEIEGYTAVVGSTSVFIYTPGTLGDVFYKKSYNASVNGQAVKNADGSDTVLVFGDNAVNKLDDAYAKLAEAKTVAFHVDGANEDAVYASGYKTILSGSLKAVYGGAAPIVETVGEETTTKAADPVETADITVTSGATLASLTVSTDLSKVTGAASITIENGATVTGAISAGDNATSTLEFKGEAKAGSVAGFTSVKINAYDIVTLSGEFSGAAITIDATDFTEYDKIVMSAKNFGTVQPTITVTGGEFTGYIKDVGEGETASQVLILSTGLVNDTYANADWSATDTPEFEGETVLTYGKNAFNSAAGAAAAITNADGVLYIEGGVFSTEEAVTLDKGNDVVIDKAATLGAITTAGSITVGEALTASGISGASALTVNAGTNALVAGSVDLAEKAALTITVGADYTQAANEAVILNTESGITIGGVELEDDVRITLTGENANRYYAYYDKATHDVVMLQLNTLYLSTAWEGGPPNMPPTFNNEPLFYNVNAFDRMNALGTNLHDGQRMWATNRNGSIHTGGPDMAEGEDGKFLSEIHITDNSTADRVVIGGTTGEGVYVGDTHVIIDKSTIATNNDNDSWLVSNVTADNPWSHRNTLFGSVTVDVTNSTIGDAANAGGTLRIMNYTYVVDRSEEEKSKVQVNFADTKVYKNVQFLGDSPMGKDVERADYSKAEGIDDKGIGTTETFEVNLNNVTVSDNRQWILRGGGSQEIETGGTFTVSMTGSTFGNNAILAIEGNWGTQTTPWDLPQSGTDFIFNLDSSTINGYLVAGRADMGNDDNDPNADLAGEHGYYGKRELNVIGTNYVKNALYFKQINLTGDSSLQGETVSLFSGEGRIYDEEGKYTVGNIDGQIKIDLTGYEGTSRVLLGLSYIYNDDEEIIGGGISNFKWNKNLVVVGNEGEGGADRYEILSDYNDDKNIISTIVLKGAVHDVYVNTEYDPEEFATFGTYKMSAYEPTGEALFFGENAFNSLVDVTDEETEEVTPGAFSVLKADPTKVLHMSGGDLTTNVLYSNSITVDATASLTYNGNEAIVVDGTIKNEGSFAVSANALTKGKTDSEILAVSAKDIEGDITIKSTLYAVENRVNEETGNEEIWLVLMADDVYVNAEWSTWEDPTVPITVTLPDGSTKELYYGLTAFADVASAYDKVAKGGSLTIMGTAVSFADAVQKNLTLTIDSTSRISNTTIGYTDTASLVVSDGATASNISVMDGSSITVGKNALVTGGLYLTANEKTTAIFDSEATLDFYTVEQKTTDGARVTNFNKITGTPKYTVTVDANAKDGKYALATGVDAAFAGNILLQTTAATFETLVVGGDRVKINDLAAYYKVSVIDNVLTLEKESVQDTIFVNSTWDPTKTYTVDGINVVIGENGFLTGDEALAKAISADASSIKVDGGVVNFSLNKAVEVATIVKSGAELSGINATGTLTVSSGAKLSGKSVFNPGEGKTITIDGAVAFNTADTADGAQIVGLSKAVFGETATFTLTVDGEVAVGDTFLLATGAEGFDKDIKVGNETLVVNGAVVNVGEVGYKLTLADGNLSFDVVEKAVLAMAYVNSNWKDATEPTVTLSDGNTATLGENAFVYYADAVKASPLAITVDGGEVAFPTGTAVPTTVNAGAIINNASTFNKTITVDGTIALSTEYTIGGISNVTGTTTEYTLSVVSTAIKDYQLATDAAALDAKTFTVDGQELTVGGGAVEFGDVKYELKLVGDTKDLYLSIFKEQEKPADVYVNSTWPTSGTVTLSDGTTAIIGENAFVTYADAINGVASSGTITIDGGVIAFADGTAEGLTTIVGAEATINGATKFNQAITVNGTIELSNTYVIEDVSFVSDGATYTLKTSGVIEAGLDKTIATGATALDGKAIVMNDSLSLTVNGSAKQEGALMYALTLSEGNLNLVVTEFIPDPQEAVYVNSTWATATTDTVTLSDGTEVTLGKEAFVTYDNAILNVKDGGTITIDGGVIAFAAGVLSDKASTIVGANATINGASVIDQAITVNGTIALNNTYTIGGIANVSGDTKYTLDVANVTVGDYTLATEAAALDAMTFTVSGTELTVNGGAKEFGDYTYELTLGEDAKLVLAITSEEPPVVKPTDVFVNTGWPTSGTVTIVTTGETGVIGYDAFVSYADAINGVADEGGTITIDGGDITFSSVTTKAITVVGAAATIVGKNTFDNAITIKGAIAFSTNYATATAAQFTGFDKVSLDANAVITITDTKLATADYVLADDISNVSLMPAITVNGAAITINGSAVTLDDVTYTLVTDDNNALILKAVKEGPTPPPTPGTTIYVNGEWADAEKYPVGTTVTVKEGVTATIGTDAFGTGDAAAEKATENDKIEIVGGTISFNGKEIDEPITIDAGSTLTGNADFGATVTVNGEFKFDTAFTVEGPQYTGLDNVVLGEGGTFRLAIADPLAEETYLLATGAEGFTGPITVTINGEDRQMELGKRVEINGTGYAYEVIDDALVLTVVGVDDGPDNGNDPTVLYQSGNNWLVDKSKLNYNKTLDQVAVTNPGQAVRVDKSFSVEVEKSGELFENCVNKTEDSIDYTELLVVDPAKLAFTVTSNSAGKVTLYKLTKAASGKYTVKSVKSASFKKDKATGLYVGNLTNALISDESVLDDNGPRYYLAVQSTKKEDGFYNVKLQEGSAVKFYDDADNGWNNTLYDKKLGPNAAVVNDENPVAIVWGYGAIQLDEEEVIGHGERTNYVGFGDAADYKKISLANAACLSFVVKAETAAKFVIYSLTFDEAKNKYTMKALQTTTLKKNSATGLFEATTKAYKLPVLTNGNYYISVQASNATKATSEAYYSVALSEDTNNVKFFDDADASVQYQTGNNWLLSKDKKQINGNLAEAQTLVAGEMVQIDAEEAAGARTNYVGFGDDTDYRQIKVGDTAASLKFKFTADDAAKFVVYQVSYNGTKYTTKALQTVTLKSGGSQESKVFDFLADGAKDAKGNVISYYLMVQSTNAKKNNGHAAYYDVQALAADADALSADTLSFAQNDTDVLAGTVSDLADLNEKSDWQSIAKLA